MSDLTEQEIRSQIADLTRQLTERKSSSDTFAPGNDPVPYAGRVYDSEEVIAGVMSMLDFWLTLGPEGEAFERELASYIGVRNSLLMNSGSSANLVAFSALTSHRLGDRRLRPGDEVITVAGGFPTTVGPIIQNGCVPVFLDNDPLTGNINVEQLDDAYVAGRTKAVMIAHTLGNPFDLKTITDFCEQHGLWLIEDNCDALGSTYGDKLTGTFGDLSTQSFYPPHHLTLGEGGAVNVTRDPMLKILCESFRDWGRDCWCASGVDNTCGKRFCWKHGELPEGYDHKYVYSHLGYNLKPLDPQAAIGRVQLTRIEQFTQARKDNWQFLRRALAPAEEFFEFSLPTHATGWSDGEFQWKSGQPTTDPSWFGFLMLVRDSAPFSRVEFAQELDRLKIGNRMLFGGNLLRQPVFVQLRKDFEKFGSPSGNAPYRVVGDLSGADQLMHQGIFLGVYPGLTQEQLEFVAGSVLSFCEQHSGRSAA
ncbi:MAG: CDP-6-deoxy-D-xylo-4-hexulose-3-dehydrase [Planctomycetaceae bacterium]|jgi:CDP-6-deoxy-D-xylo-4-hexulose-3-dehydrase